MKLWTAHRILIVAAIVLGLGLALWGYQDWHRLAHLSSLTLAVLGGVISAGGLAYLAWFNRKIRNLEDRQP